MSTDWKGDWQSWVAYESREIYERRGKDKKLAYDLYQYVKGDDGTVRDGETTEQKNYGFTKFYQKELIFNCTVKEGKIYVTMPDESVKNFTETDDAIQHMARLTARFIYSRRPENEAEAA